MKIFVERIKISCIFASLINKKRSYMETKKSLPTNNLNANQILELDAYVSRSYWAFCDYMELTCRSMRDNISEQYYKEHHEELDALVAELRETRNRIADSMYNINKRSLQHVLRSINYQTE